jgi:putative toxin-antitoxin system antitoxin component (TIGR02293 family)
LTLDASELQPANISDEVPMTTTESARSAVLAKATRVFGSCAEADAWLVRPAIGLEQQRPVDLLTTPEGLEAVMTFLTRLEYGVYT